MSTFWSKVQKSHPYACWEWKGSASRGTRGGGLYGQYREPSTGRRFQAHRYCYLLAGGTIPDGFVVHHTCGNTLCVNPSHLEPLDQATHSKHHNVKPCEHGSPTTQCQDCETARRLGIDGTKWKFSPQSRANISSGMVKYWARRKAMEVAA